MPRCGAAGRRALEWRVALGRGAGQGCVYAFRGAARSEATHAYMLRGLDHDGKYRLRVEGGAGADQVATGAERMTHGVEVRWAEPLSSELVWVEKAQ